MRVRYYNLTYPYLANVVCHLCPHLGPNPYLDIQTFWKGFKILLKGGSCGAYDEKHSEKSAAKLFQKIRQFSSSPLETESKLTDERSSRIKRCREFIICLSCVPTYIIDSWLWTQLQLMEFFRTWVWKIGT